MKDAISLFAQFFVLGCTSFGGPAAHLGYFRKTFVEDKKWISESAYSQLIALSQFLPGPGSSQVGFAIGLHRMGLTGGVLAFVGFTLPSFIIMLLLAVGLTNFGSSSVLNSIISVFKLLAVAVVADTVLTMGKSFCQSRTTQLLAFVTCIIIWLFPVPFVQILCISAAAIFGLFSLSTRSTEQSSKLNWSFSFSTVFFIVLFVVCISGVLDDFALFSETFLAGSLVFGGGHVVLPLLQDYFAQSIGHESFITGYAAAQALPGPLFTFATYLGAMSHENPLIGACIATLGVFLPGFLLVLAFNQHWKVLANHSKVSGAILGVNASVVGLLAATLFSPVFITSVKDSLDMAVVATIFVLLGLIKLSIIRIILLVLAYGLLNAWLT
jgi:chromate transporter